MRKSPRGRKSYWRSGRVRTTWTSRSPAGGGGAAGAPGGACGATSPHRPGGGGGRGGRRVGRARAPARGEVRGDVGARRAAEARARVVPAEPAARRVRVRVVAVASELGEVDATHERDLLVDDHELLVMAVQ